MVSSEEKPLVLQKGLDPRQVRRHLVSLEENSYMEKNLSVT